MAEISINDYNDIIYVAEFVADRIGYYDSSLIHEAAHDVMLSGRPLEDCGDVLSSHVSERIVEAVVPYYNLGMMSGDVFCERCGFDLEHKGLRYVNKKWYKWNSLCNQCSMAVRRTVGLLEYNRKRKWYEGNMEKQAFYNQVRRARISRTENSLSLQDWEDIKTKFNNSCAYCGIYDCRLAKEHVIPVSKGGGFTKRNIIPSCKSCNSSKNNLDLLVWYPNNSNYNDYRLTKILTHCYM